MASNKERLKARQATEKGKTVTLPESGEVEVYKLRKASIRLVAASLQGDIIQRLEAGDIAAIIEPGSELADVIIADGLRLGTDDDVGDIIDAMELDDVKEAILSIIEHTFGEEGFKGFFSGWKERSGLGSFSLGEVSPSNDQTEQPSDSSESQESPDTDSPLPLVTSEEAFTNS